MKKLIFLTLATFTLAITANAENCHSHSKLAGMYVPGKEAFFSDDCGGPK